MIGWLFNPPYFERGWRRAFWFLAALGAIVTAPGVLKAHGPYDHFNNPVSGMSCCNDRDCKAMTADEVEARIREVPKGITVDGKFVSDRELQEGPDGRWHICEHPDTKYLFCVLKPRPSF